MKILLNAYERGEQTHEIYLNRDISSHLKSSGKVKCAVLSASAAQTSRPHYSTAR